MPTTYANLEPFFALFHFFPFQLFWNSLNYAFRPSLAHNGAFIILIHRAVCAFFSSRVNIALTHTPFHSVDRKRVGSTVHCTIQCLRPYYQAETPLVRVLRGSKTRLRIFF